MPDDSLAASVYTRSILNELRSHPGRTRISFTNLAAKAHVPVRSLPRWLAHPTVRAYLKKRSWRITDSKALGLPPLEHNPRRVGFLVRDNRNPNP